MIYILDTNIISAIIKENEKVKRKVEKMVKDGNKILINGICYYEVKRGLLAVNATAKLRKFEHLCKSFELVLLDNLTIFDIAAEIWVDLKRRGKPLRNHDTDILIASITRYRNSILVSDDSGFDRIKNLTVENWLT